MNKRVAGKNDAQHIRLIGFFATNDTKHLSISAKFLKSCLQFSRHCLISKSCGLQCAASRRSSERIRRLNHCVPECKHLEGYYLDKRYVTECSPVNLFKFFGIVKLSPTFICGTTRGHLVETCSRQGKGHRKNTTAPKNGQIE